MASDNIQCILVVVGAFMIIGTNDGTMCIFGIYASYWMKELKATRFQLDWIGSIQMGLAFCLGIGFGMAYMSAVVAVTLNFDEKRPLAMGVVTCGTGVGCSILSIVIPIVIEEIGWRKSMFVLAAITLNLSLYGTMLQQRRPTERLRRVTGFTGQLMVFDPYWENRLRMPSELLAPSIGLPSNWEMDNIMKHKNLTHMLGNLGSFVYMDELDRLLNAEGRTQRKRMNLCKNTQFLVLLMAAFLFSFTFMTPIVYLFDRLRQKNIPDSLISMIMSAYGIFGAVTRLLVGVMASFKWCQKRIFMLFWVMLSAVASICSNYITESWQFAIYSSVLGGSSGAFIVLQPLVLAEIVSKDELTDALGIVLFSAGFGYLIGPPTMALVYGHFKSYDACYMACGVLVGVAGLHVAFLVCVTCKQIILEKKESRLKRRLEADMRDLRDEESESQSTSVSA